MLEALSSISSSILSLVLNLASNLITWIAALVIGVVLEHYEVIHIRKGLIKLMYMPQLNEIRNNKILPCVEEIVLECNNRLSTDVTAEEIAELIILDPAGMDEEQIGKVIILPISGSALKEKTLSYETTEVLAKFIFKNATQDLLIRNKKLRDVAERVILQGGISKVSENYGTTFVDRTNIDEDAVEDFTRCTTRKEYFKSQILPLLKPGNDDTIFRKLKSEAARSEKEEDLANPVYAAKRFEEMEPRISEEEMVKLTIGDHLQGPHYYAYVRGLKYVYENPNSRLIDISKGLGIPMPTAYFLAVRHTKKTQLIEKVGRGYKVSSKYTQLRTKIEHENKTTSINDPSSS